jgi:hypothetical protein
MHGNGHTSNPNPGFVELGYCYRLTAGLCNKLDNYFISACVPGCIVATTAPPNHRHHLPTIPCGYIPGWELFLDIVHTSGGA